MWQHGALAKGGDHSAGRGIGSAVEGNGPMEQCHSALGVNSSNGSDSFVVNLIRSLALFPCSFTVESKHSIPP